MAAAATASAHRLPVATEKVPQEFRDYKVFQNAPLMLQDLEERKSMWLEGRKSIFAWIWFEQRHQQQQPEKSTKVWQRIELLLRYIGYVDRLHGYVTELPRHIRKPAAIHQTVVGSESPNHPFRTAWEMDSSASRQELQDQFDKRYQNNAEVPYPLSNSAMATIQNCWSLSTSR
jgi:hypothetical protein